MDRIETPPSTLRRLSRDRAGNTIAMIGAAMIPLAGMMGSAIDMSRAYLVKTRLQQACDAAALAGRRSMQGSVIDSSDRAEAGRFFNFNFPTGTMSAAPMTVDPASSTVADYIKSSLTTDKQYRVDASTTIPNPLMQMFGIPRTRVTVTCVAEEYLVNSELMLVLDTTRSMNCLISEATATACPATEKTDSKMYEMRQAVKTLYAQLRPAQLALEAKGYRMRLGWVNYAHTVNVGKLLYAANPSYFQAASTYYTSSGTPYNSTNTASFMSSSSWNGCIEERSTNAGITAATTSIPNDAYDLDLTLVPNGNDATKWRPHKPGANAWLNTTTTYDDPSLVSSGFSSCMRPAQPLKVWGSTSEFDTQIDTIKDGSGGTYHDIGMIWGARMIANGGVFATAPYSNPDTYNGAKVRRTLVLLTDGLMSPSQEAYSAYSVHSKAKRVYSGTDQTTLTGIHERRFNLVCERAKSMGIDVWVVAILDSATPISTSLSNCAASGQAMKVSNTTALTNAFKKIGDKVGNLRIGE